MPCRINDEMSFSVYLESTEGGSIQNLIDHVVSWDSRPA